ncbi:MAG: hypothetical protein ACLRVT_05395 [Oscillospiraceae bacterium]
MPFINRHRRAALGLDACWGRAIKPIRYQRHHAAAPGASRRPHANPVPIKTALEQGTLFLQCAALFGLSIPKTKRMDKACGK